MREYEMRGKAVTDTEEIGRNRGRRATSQIGSIAALVIAGSGLGGCGDSKSTPDTTLSDTTTDTAVADVAEDTAVAPDVAADVAPVDVAAETTPTWPAVVLNEIAPAGDPSDWVELFNPTETAADLGGWMLTDSDPLHIYTFPAGTTVAAGGWLVVESGTDGFDFGLGSGDSARLLAPDGTVKDETDWTPETLPRAANFGRFPNGSGPFKPLYITTRGEVNVDNPETVCGDETIASPEVCDTDDFDGDTCEARGWAGGSLTCADECMRIDTAGCTALEPALVLNEVTSSGDDRIELYNGTDATIDLGGWSLSDEGGGVWVLPAETSIDAGAYLVFVKDVHHTFGLGGADSVTLKDTTDTMVDKVSWPDGAAAVSYCRRPNGVGGFEPCPSASFGGENF